MTLDDSAVNQILHMITFFSRWINIRYGRSVNVMKTHTHRGLLGVVVCSDWTVSVQEYMLTVSLGEELVLLGTSGTFLKPPLRVIVLLSLDCSGCLKCS